MILEFIFSTLLAGIVYQITKLLIRGQSSQSKHELPPGYLRELSLAESIFHSQFKLNGYLLSSNIILKSYIRMHNAKVEESLQLLAKRHPLLQAAITEVNSEDGKHYYFTKMSSLRVDYRRSNKLATEPTHWHDVMTKDLIQPINTRDGPLWRCHRLKECIDSESRKVTNCFVFTFNHAIIDGISMTMLYKDFLLILHKLHRNTNVEEISYDLRPSFEMLLGAKFHPEWWRRIVIKVVEILFNMGLFSLKSKKIDIYLNKYPVIRNLYPDVKPDNCAIFTSFSKSETKKLLSACKEHGCTVNGAITAAANMAMADILQDGRITQAQIIPSKYSIDCRRYVDLNENENFDYLGVCIFSSKLNCYIPRYNSQSFRGIFWKTANDITDNVHKTVKSEAPLHFMKNLQCLSVRAIESMFNSRRSEHHGGRPGDSLFYISNMGRFDDSSNGDHLFTIEKMFFHSAKHKVGNMFLINLITVNGMLCCSFSYCPHITAKSQAEEFNAKFLKYLRVAFNES